MVVPDGFIWRGETYPSLSATACKITGVNWSGPRFFGLAGADAAPAAVADDNARAKGQAAVCQSGAPRRPPAGPSLMPSRVREDALVMGRKGSRIERSQFACRNIGSKIGLVSGKIVVDQTRDVVILFFFEECIFARIVLDLDVFGCGGDDLVRVGSIDFVERDEFRRGFRAGFFVLRRAGARVACDGKVEDRPAFGANDRALVKIEEFRAALLALMFIAEFGFCHRLVHQRPIGTSLAPQ
jgi:hypothetical protein